MSLKRSSLGSDHDDDKSGTTQESSGVWSVSSNDDQSSSSSLSSSEEVFTASSAAVSEAITRTNDDNNDAHELEKIAELERCLEQSTERYNLLLTGCFISSALNHAAATRQAEILSDHHDDKEEEIQRVKDELETVRTELEISEKRIVAAECEKVEELEKQINELVQQLNNARDQGYQEKCDLHNEMEKIRANEICNRDRSNHLQNILGEIESELESMEETSEQEPAPLQTSVVARVRVLLDTQTKYTQLLTKHQEKEAAFRETLAEADIIMTNIENDYKSKLAELEDEKHQLEEKLSHACDLQMFLQSAGSDNREMVEKMYEKEKSELSLMDQVFSLERTIKQLSQVASDKDMLKNELHDSMKDQEEIISQIESLQRENRELEQEIVEKREVEHRLMELQQTETYLRGRLEELETSESVLRDSLSNLEQRSVMRERKLCEDMNVLKDELVLLQSQASRPADQDDNLKMECEALKERLRRVNENMKEQSRQFTNTEASLKQELMKVRNSVSVVNKQLEEYDEENCGLKMKLSTTESSLRDKLVEVDDLRDRLEKSDIEHSSIVTEKERMIDNLSQQLNNNTDSHLELSELSTDTRILEEIQHWRHSLATCDECNNDCDKLSDLIQSLLMNQGNMRVQHMDNTSMDMVRAISEDNILDIVNTEDESLLLESQLAELTDKLDRMEEEMVILSEESSNLQQALEIKESVILDQVSHFFHES